MLRALPILGLLVLSSTQSWAKLDHQEIQNAINDNNLDWEAGPTWISELSDEEARKFYGAEDMPQGKLKDDRYNKSAVQTAPEELDWRNKNGVNWLTPVKNQANCGSCVSFASIATFEAMLTINAKNAAYKPILSTQNLFACGGGLCERGWTTVQAAEHLKNAGVVDQACVPYVSGSTAKDEPCTKTCTDYSKRIKKISNYKMVGSNSPAAGSTWNARPAYQFSTSITDIKKALKSGPLLTKMTVYEDFESYKGGIYKHVKGSALGGHAVSLVGFSDSGRYWIVRNSWGENWGEKGYFRVSWDDDSGVGLSSISFNVEAQTNFLNFQYPVSKKFYSGLMYYNVETSSLINQNTKLTLRNTDKSVIETFTCDKFNVSYCLGHIDTTQFPDGKYELVASNDSTTATPIYFYISNNEPQKVVNFKITPLKTTFDQALSGYVDVDLELDFQSLPFEKLHIKMLDKTTGEEVYSKEFEEVFPKMRVGFKTSRVKNGSYNLRMQGYFPTAKGNVTRKSRLHPITIKNEIQ